MKVKLNHQKPFLKKHTPSSIGTLKGEIYENFIFEKLQLIYPYLEFISAKIPSKKIKNKNENGFYYSKTGQILYFENKKIIAEFDAIAISNKTIYLFEITRISKKYKRYAIEKILRKYRLLKNIFPNYEVKLTIITPKRFSAFEKTGSKILEIPEPNYENYYNIDFYNFNDALISNCSPILTLNEIIKNLPKV